MAPRPASPTSLLWAHQLKKEHDYLLKRMSNLESESEKQDSKIKDVEKTAKQSAADSSNNKDFTVLARHIEALDKKSDKAGVRISEMEKDVTQRLDDAQADNEALTLKIDALQKTHEIANEDERKKSISKEQTLLKRIGEVEAGLKTYQQQLDRIGKSVNGSHFEQIQQQLDGLTKQVKQEGGQMKMLTESVAALEIANDELSKANKKLEAELERVAIRAASRAQVTATPKAPAEKVETATEREQDPEQQAIAGAESEPRKKSHKWAGGGADKDIIRLGAEVFGHEVKHTPKAPHSAPPVAKKIPVPPQKKAKKKVVPPKKTTGSPKKSHRWAGGGADKDIIQAGFQAGSRTNSSDHSSQNIVVKRKRSSDANDEIETAPRKKIKKAAGDSAEKNIIDKGKGWITVARSPTPPPSSGPVKRARGRPKKIPTPKEELEALTDGPVTRRNVKQPTQTQSTSNKKNGTVARFPNLSTDTSPEPAHLLGSSPLKKRREPNIFSSPVCSPPPRGTDLKEPHNRFTTDVEQAPTHRRRRIIQEDDISTIKLHMNV